ncbi:MAG: aquaporin Z [Micavibrio sp.]
MGLRKLMMAEMLGTAWLVLGGCGAAVFAAAYPELGIGFLGVALAFGLTVVGGAYALGHISGAHFNPAVTLGLLAAGRMELRLALPYIAAQVVGGIIGAGIIYMIATGKAGFDVTAGFATNGYGEHSPGGYGLQAAFTAEAVLTFFFLFVILGATSSRAPASMAPLAIGLTLTLIHLICIPITNTSVNPARSTAVAVFQGGWAVEQLWLFWVAPLLGGALAGFMDRCCNSCCSSEGGCGCSSK